MDTKQIYEELISVFNEKQARKIIEVLEMLRKEVEDSRRAKTKDDSKELKDTMKESSETQDKGKNENL